MTEQQAPHFSPQPKVKVKKNPDYIKSTRLNGEQWHHEPSLPGAEKLMSGKCSDYYGVSLNPELHRRRHDLGFLTFWAGMFNLDVMSPEIRALVTVEVQRIVIQDLIAYIESKRRGNLL